MSNQPAVIEYKRTKILGKGTYGTAYLAHPKHAPDEKLVVKAVPLSGLPKKDFDDSVMEAKLLEEFDHPYILGHIDHWVGEDETLYIVTEYADAGDLQALVKKAKKTGELLPEDLIWNWIVQLCLAMKHVHDRKILHRDIKTANIFLQTSQSQNGRYNVKLGDFGISKVLEHTQANAKTSVGTPYYMSPELCQHRPYNAKSDMWAIGCVCYELCTLRNPFDAANFNALCVKILKGKYRTISSHYSQDLHDIVEKLLARDPKKRPSVNELLEMPLMQKRLADFKAEHPEVARDELSHTVLHGFKPFSGSRQPSFTNPEQSISKPASVQDGKSRAPVTDTVVAQPSGPPSPTPASEENGWDATDADGHDASQEARDGLDAAARGEKFHYAGKTLHLPGQTENETQSERIERLRLFLEEGLGATLFLQVYRIMQGINSDTNESELEETLVSIVGIKKIEYLNVVCQLIFCEDMNGNEQPAATVDASETTV